MRLSPLTAQGINTRYGWVANPYPTGTLTLQDSPGFARRDNGNHQRRAPLARPMNGFVSRIFCLGHCRRKIYHGAPNFRLPSRRGNRRIAALCSGCRNNDGE